MRDRARVLGVVAAAVVVASSAACGADSDTPSTSAAPDPVTVEQLVERSADTPIEVRGLLYVDEGGTRLCAAVLESYPPQCGEPSVELVGLDLSAVDGTTTEGSITWKEGAVLTLQRAPDARFTVLAVEG